MKVLVLGAGVVGTAAAWYLVERGHEVTVVDRQSAVGMETSFANGGQLSASHPEPWASPESRAKAREWMRRSDLPVSFRLRWRRRSEFGRGNSCGSGAALADIISGRKPEVDFRFT